jgi:GH24 family phage-related lysozyme (muramidase)
MMQAVSAGKVTQANFTAYRFIKKDGKYVESQGLINRRKAEYLLYSQGVY